MGACKVILYRKDNLLMKKFRTRFAKPLLLLISTLILQVGTGHASEAKINDIRLWTAPDHTRLVFDLDRSVSYEVFRLGDPERIVIDIRNVKLNADPSTLELPDPVVQTLRHGKPEPSVLRVVLDVKEKVNPRSFLLKPMQGKPHRLVVDLMRSTQEEEEKRVVTAEDMRSRKEVVIAVDAGHGGEDPGAIGRNGLQEKTVTLSVAKALAAKINATEGMRAVLIREGDYFVPLKKRVLLARKSRADMMISIHADAVRNRKVEGASVYTLSERGATQDKVAAALAAKENAADQVGGFDPGEVDDPMVSMILGDMAKRDSLNSAYLLAETILKDFEGVGPVKYSEPKSARFVVLGALEIPSVLVEMDYISNPSRERLLRSSRHQQQIVSALLNSSISFLRRQGRISRTEHAPVYRFAGLTTDEMSIASTLKPEGQHPGLPDA